MRAEILAALVVFRTHRSLFVFRIHHIQRDDGNPWSSHEAITSCVRGMVFAISIHIFRVVFVVYQGWQGTDQIRATPTLRRSRTIEDLPQWLLHQLPLVVFLPGQIIAQPSPTVFSIILGRDHRPAIRGHDFADGGAACCVIEAGRIAHLVAQLLIAGESDIALRKSRRVLALDIGLAIGENAAFRTYGVPESTGGRAKSPIKAGESLPIGGDRKE